MKFKTFLAMYKNIIIIVWCIIILIIFKIWNNFEFSNGNSLLFIALFFIIPLVLYIFGLIYKRKLIKQKNLKKGPYIEIIKNDLKTNRFQKEFLDKLSEFKFLDKVIDNKIVVANDKVEICFTKEFATLIIKNTMVIYRYYYTLNLKDFSRYDKRLIQYHNTTYLYKLIIDKVNVLYKNPLTYMENKKDCKLIDSITKELLFTNLNKLKKKKYSRIVEIDLKKS